MRNHAMLTAGLLLSLACGQGTVGVGDDLVIDMDEQLVAQHNIIGGSLPDGVEHDAVVGLHRVRGKSVSLLPFCSGTLITETVVLTAAHCAAVIRRANKVLVYVGDDPLADYQAGNLSFSTVTQVWAHPAYDSRVLTNDIALLRLADAAPAEPVPALPASLGLSQADLGATIGFAGFGQDETGEYGVKLQADGVLGALGCGVAGCPSPGEESTQLSYEQGSAGPCFGDSGGPAFLVRSGTPYVAGITSYGDMDCLVYGVSTRADAFEAEIQSFVGL